MISSEMIVQIELALKSIVTLNEEMGGVQKAGVAIQTDIEWIKWFIRLIGWGTVVLVISAFANLFLTNRNGKRK